MDSFIPSVTIGEREEEHVHVLLWQAHGCSNVMIGEKEYVLTVDRVLWVPATCRHGFTVQDNSVIVPLFFDSRSVATSMGLPALIPIGEDLKVLMLAYSVTQGSVLAPPTNLARQILSMIEQRPHSDGEPPLPLAEPAKSIADALRFNPGDVRSAEELAASVHTSLRTIERMFKSETGLTLRKWRIRNRMQAAAGLLRSESSIDAVAYRVGYTNPNSFRRAFTDHHGVSPLRYVKRVAASRRDDTGAES